MAAIRCHPIEEKHLPRRWPLATTNSQGAGNAQYEEWLTVWSGELCHGEKFFSMEAAQKLVLDAEYVAAEAPDRCVEPSLSYRKLNYLHEIRHVIGVENSCGASLYRWFEGVGGNVSSPFNRKDIALEITLCYTEKFAKQAEKKKKNKGETEFFEAEKEWFTSGSPNKLHSAPSQSQAAQGRVRKIARWNQLEYKVFIDTCELVVAKGHRRGKCFSSIGWHHIAAMFNTSTGKDWTVSQMKNYWNKLRTDHKCLF
ncbi:unnamed protein product [Fraxinus pennsylvanica]|uniref:Myb/SANT-like domain-containing protein n=1 Tax=Fraxinus pennsylvanica TaxID=56036 RepID=A0AAD2EEV2_9LAMI|nr:unnamed protein product [Fraxinus pennsylvanica]